MGQISCPENGDGRQRNYPELLDEQPIISTAIRHWVLENNDASVALIRGHRCPDGFVDQVFEFKHVRLVGNTANSKGNLVRNNGRRSDRSTAAYGQRCSETRIAAA